MAETKRGWTSSQLSVIPDDDSYWSTADAALRLGSAASEIRNLIRMARIQPVGKRKGVARKGGRYVRVYSAAEIASAYEAVTFRGDS